MKSNREQHIPANVLASVLIGGIDAIVFATPESLITSVSCFLTELWAWPDRDIQHQRRDFFLVHWYWMAYEKCFIPHHRHPMSHSLWPGLVIRLLWGFWPTLIYVDATLQPWRAMGFDWQYFPVALLPIVARTLIGAIVSDCIHYLMDGYTPDKWVFGKK